MEIKDLISTLLFSRNQAQVFHWQTRSFAKHKALEDYYSSVVDLVDTIVESYQSKEGIITIFSNNDKYSYGEDTVLSYFETLLKTVETNRKVVGADSDLQNIVDEVISLIKSTIYKLKFLS